jgi:POLQ-like helicase
MKPERQSKTLLGVTRSRAKMFEYRVPAEDHIQSPRDPSRLFSLAIGLLGDYCSQFNSGGVSDEEQKESRDDLRFSAQFFDSFRDARVNEGVSPYVLLIGSATYYICELPGSADVLARRLPEQCPPLDGGGLEELILWLLKGDFSTSLVNESRRYGSLIAEISAWHSDYFRDGGDESGLDLLLKRLRRRAYRKGTARELLFADIACTLARLRFTNSCRYSMPRYSNLTAEEWEPYFDKPRRIWELWPAQHLLGAAGVFAGRSAIIQMPTSAGKTRGTELIIRSSFLAERATLAVIVAPFRALCHEIRKSYVAAFASESVNVDELSDVAQPDFDVSEFLTGKQIIIVTPEKLLYVLRHNPELADSIGLIIYDEGHQFDSGTRGVTYELLVTSLKALIPKDAQTILISAVISNGESINGWLTEKAGILVQGIHTIPTYRSLAFTSWTGGLGRLEFVEPSAPDTREFYVPRVLEVLPLDKLKQREKERTFPARDDGQDIALYLGTKLVNEGSVAIFCGTKAIASNLASSAANIFARNVALPKPVLSSDEAEVGKLAKLYESHLGADADAFAAARVGVFTHHGNTPHGLRLAVEHAMKEGLAAFVICTSTLAQGVNLPIRYLLITGTYQGQDEIKTRDFHNLMGRAGRAGMHTEGSVLFANPTLFDEREEVGNGTRRWGQVRSLLDPSNSEPCVSSLLSVFDPYESDNGLMVVTMDPLEFVTDYIKDVSSLKEKVRQLALQLSGSRFTEAGLLAQAELKAKVVAAVESYLMSLWDEDGDMAPETVASLAQGTLAYYLATDEQKKHLLELFSLLAANIRTKVATPELRRIFARILYGVYESNLVQEWVVANNDAITATTTSAAMLELLWPIISRCVHNPTFNRMNPATVLPEIAQQWIRGESFEAMFGTMNKGDARIGFGSRPRKPKIDNAVDVGENAAGYDAMLVVGAVAELYELSNPDNSNQIELLKLLQKQIKYGLPTVTSILLCEIGFADRVVAQRLAEVVGGAATRRKLLSRIRSSGPELRSALDEFPAYFTSVLNSLIG